MSPSYGVYTGLVVDLRDPLAQGRVRVKVPSATADATTWARLATLTAGNDRGSWFVPEVGDEVLVAFEAGDTGRPYVLGALWNGKSRPPVRATSGNDVKMLRTRSGITITLSDEQGQEELVLETPGGQRLTLKNGPGAVEMVDGNGNAIRLEPSGITISAAVRVSVQASQVTVSAGSVEIDAGVVQCSGLLRANSIITNSIVSASYSPGAGNVM